ncbi:MAG TPA: hypothetical protein VLF95_12245 [Vicinamibacteria bacterium]|nr:hypothetical protein [Vicinamibacteria bacterium]
MNPTAKKRPSLLPWLVGVALLGGVAPAAAQRGARACLAPGGGDDTASLQAALDRCSGARQPCTVTLCAGTFDTGILRVRDFRGTLRGAGPERTTLRARPDLPVSENLRDFFRDDPFEPTRAWPYLVQFVEGRALVADLGVLVPAPPAGSQPTTGWYLLDDGPIFELRGGLLFTGRGPVDFEVRDVRVAAEDPGTDLGTTAFSGVEFGGLLHDPGDAGDFPVFPARGRFHVADCVFDGVLTGTPLAELAAAQVLVARNRYRATIAVEVIDADRSRITVLGNRWRASYRGVQVRQNLDGSPSRASEIRVSANRGAIAPLFAGLGDGLSYEDPAGPTLDPGATALSVTRNRFELGGGVEPVASGIAANGAGRLRLGENRLAGRAGAGLEVDATSGCRVWGNATAELDTGNGPDLHLGSATSDCLAIVGPGDVVVDEGSANRVVRW